MREVEDVFTSDVPLVATCRIADVMRTEPSLQDESMAAQIREVKAMQIAERRLVRAIEAGARYVDVSQPYLSKRKAPTKRHGRSKLSTAHCADTSSLKSTRSSKLRRPPKAVRR